MSIDIGLSKYIKRAPTRMIYVGNVPVGGDTHIKVQSMTNTKTTDIEATLEQILNLQKAGADMVRVSLPTMRDAECFKIIRRMVNIPLIADIHFDYRIAIKAAEYGADCLRINPGNIGDDKKAIEVIRCAKRHSIPIRIGVNAGSIDYKNKSYAANKPNKDIAKDLVECATRNIQMLESNDFYDYKISLKASNVDDTVRAYRMIKKSTNNPLHIGVTEAGGLIAGTVKSAVAFTMLLLDGIGDTLRVSLSADPVQEVKVGYEILKALNLRKRGINFISCPTCARQEFDVISTVNALEERLSDISEPINVSIIGCVVNGPGEATHADIGLAGAKHKSSYYEDGQRIERLDNSKLVDLLEERIRQKIAKMRANNEMSNCIPVKVEY